MCIFVGSSYPTEHSVSRKRHFIMQIAFNIANSLNRRSYIESIYVALVTTVVGFIFKCESASTRCNARHAA